MLFFIGGQFVFRTLICIPYRLFQNNAKLRVLNFGWGKDRQKKTLIRKSINWTVLFMQSDLHRVCTDNKGIRPATAQLFFYDQHTRNYPVLKINSSVCLSFARVFQCSFFISGQFVLRTLICISYRISQEKAKLRVLNFGWPLIGKEKTLIRKSMN